MEELKKMDIITIMLMVLGALGLWFAFLFIRDFVIYKNDLEKRSWITTLIIGFVVNFFDVLGIGSFAPTTALLRATKQCDDRFIPGVLNIGCCIPVILEAILFIDQVEVDPITLVSLIGAATVGAYVGSKVVSHLPTKKIQFVMGIALLITASIFILQQLGLWTTGDGNTDIGLTGIKLVVGVVIYFVLGAMMPAGVGLYGPGMAAVFLLGLQPLAAFPLVMGSCAFLMPVASAKFIKEKAYERLPSMAITLGGVVGVTVAVNLVLNIPIKYVIWLVIVVVLYTSITLLRAATKKEAA